jgi:hypothetical protein
VVYRWSLIKHVALLADEQVAVVAGKSGEIGDVLEIRDQQGIEPLLL